MLAVFRSGIDFLKKAFLVMVVFGAIFAIFGSVINSNRPKYDEKKVLQASQKQLYDTFSREKLGIKKGSGKDLVLSIYKMGYCAFMGELCTEKLTYDANAFKGSLMGQVSNLISMTYINPPASGVYWVTNTLQNAGFIPQSYAAEGMGFAMIKPLMNLWKIFRDIAYLVIVVFLVVIGFMIMFRTKINPQTVISVENSLPKVVIALLLITFSFAIAGFLIDLMYLLIVLAIGILSNNNTYYDAAQIQNHYLQANFGTIWTDIVPLPSGLNDWVSGYLPFSYIGDSFMALLPTQVNWVLGTVARVAGVWLGGHFILNVINSTGANKILSNMLLAGFGVGEAPNVFISSGMLILAIPVILGLIVHGMGFVVGIIVGLAILGMIFNIFLMLLKAYIQVTISIILSPIILLFEALPGNNNFSMWVKNLIGELLTFPTVIVLLLVEKTMFMTMTYPGDFWTPPFLVNMNPGTFSVIVGLGIILITPDIVKLVKDAVGAKPLPFNIGIGTFLGGAGSVTGGGMAILQQFSTLSMGLSGISNITGLGKAKANSKPSLDDHLAFIKGLNEDQLKNLMSGGKK